jgi:hypothetical protein
MLASDSPTFHLKFRPAAILKVYFSAKQIDATASREPLKKFMDGTRRGNFQQAAFPDSISLK